MDFQRQDGRHALRLDEVPGIEVGAGCLRRALPAVAGVRTWVVDMAPGAQWPHVDHHDTGESYYVIHGEIIEGDARYGAGTYVAFGPDTRHRPRTETGVRLIGFNLDGAAFLAAGGDPDALAETWFPPQG
jgi:hypothetical protein